MHAHDTRGAAWVQVLCKEGGMPLIMYNDGVNCLHIAAEKGYAAVVEVGAGGGRQREAGGRVSAAARGAGAVGSTLQHAAPRCHTLQHAVVV